MSERPQNKGMNALSVLMQASHRQSTAKRKRTSSRFVLCPAGCGKSIADSLINVHLDQCIRENNESVTYAKDHFLGSEDPATSISEVVERSETGTGADAGANNQLGVVTQELEGKYLDAQAKDPNDQGTIQPRMICGTKDDDVSKCSPPANVTKLQDRSCTTGVATLQLARQRASGAPDAFTRMMERSKVVFASSGGCGPIQQCLYVDVDGCVTLIDNVGRSIQNKPFAWSNVVVLKNRFPSDNGDESNTGRQRRPVELTVATSQSNEESLQIRLVRQHSRLSVPVLKSILQKSIRRRKPLPAVRVAMELADKSLGDLLRRLPIIILEDSTLHPDIPWLVWLMVAHSKDFSLPRAWLTRLMRIVFEVAACQWMDHPSFCDAQERDVPTFESLQASELAGSPSCAMLWSLLVRAEYGGMKCDVDRLLQFTRLWHTRFGTGFVASDVASRLVKDGSALHWQDVPTRIHERSRAHSLERVTPLCTRGIDRLVLEDISAEGIDFHCSPIVDHLLSLPLVGLCTDILILSQEEDVPTTIEARRSWMEGIFKSCLWSYCSGVNRRHPLVADRGCGPENPTKYQELWNELIAKEVLRYQMSFVRERLAQQDSANK